MTKTSKDLKQEIAKIKTMRDELRLRIHLASMDARQGFDRLGTEAEEALRDTGRLTRAAVADLGERLRKAVVELSDHHPQ